MLSHAVSIDSFLFYFAGLFTMFHLVNNHQSSDFHNYLEIFLKNKAPDCIIYSEDGAVFKTHKELFCQTNFMRAMLRSQNCCGVMEVIFPCSKEELGHLMKFLKEGKIKCNKKIDSLKIIENLNKILGYPYDYIYRCHQCNKSFQSLDQHLEEANHQLKPFKCGYCEDCFSSYQNFGKHVTEMHHCHYCNSYLSDLKKHVLKEHGKQRCEMFDFCLFENNDKNHRNHELKIIIF